MVEWSLHNKKLRCLLIRDSWSTEIWFFSITEPCRDNLKPWFLIKSGYYIVPSPSTALLHRVFLRSITFLKSEYTESTKQRVLFGVYEQYFGYIYNFEKGEKNIYGVSLKMQCIFTKKIQSIVVVRSKVALTLTSKSNTLCRWHSGLTPNLFFLSYSSFWCG